LALTEYTTPPNDVAELSSNIEFLNVILPEISAIFSVFSVLSLLIFKMEPLGEVLLKKYVFSNK